MKNIHKGTKPAPIVIFILANKKLFIGPKIAIEHTLFDQKKQKTPRKKMEKVENKTSNGFLP